MELLILKVLLGLANSKSILCGEVFLGRFNNDYSLNFIII